MKQRNNSPRTNGAARVSKRYRSLTVAALIILTNLCYAMNATDQTRYTALTKEIRCVVCQNQNIADSDAPLANDLRKKIYTMVEENKTDNDIKDYLVARYGEFVLLKPRFNKLTIILWLFPFACLLILSYCFYAFLTRKS